MEGEGGIARCLIDLVLHCSQDYPYYTMVANIMVRGDQCTGETHVRPRCLNEWMIMAKRQVANISAIL